MKTPFRFQFEIIKRNELGERINTHMRKQLMEAREEYNLSQRELSKLLRRSSAYISQVESGRLELSALDLIAIALTLRKSIGYFLPQGIKQDEDPLTDKEWQLVRQFRKIPTGEAQDVAIKQVKQLAEMKGQGKK